MADSSTKPPFSKLPSLDSLEWLQGKDLLQKNGRLNLCLLWQVNCPGCHTHAIPLANKLFALGEAKFDIYAVATAFEDFELNTLDNCLLLLQQGIRVGVAKDQLGAVANPNEIPSFPVAFDTIFEKNEADDYLIVQSLAATKYNTREHLQSRYGSEMLNLDAVLGGLEPQVLPQRLGIWFYASVAQGTPTWILHKDDGTILDRKFGHLSQTDVIRWTSSFMEHT